MKPLRWLIPWEPSFAVGCVTTITAILFIRGCLSCKRLFRQKLYFWIGLLSLYLAIHTQVDYYAEHEFFVHQLQSLVLHSLGPFFMVLGCPKEVLSAGLPLASKPLFQKISTWRPVKGLINLLLHPVVGVVLYVGVMLLWLLPSIHFIAMLDWRIYRLMNWSMIINGLMFWGLTLDLNSIRSPIVRIAMMLAVVPPQILIGSVIFFTPHDLYPIYALCGRAFEGIGLITDQQIGGLILWMHAAMMSVIGILIVISTELKQPKRLVVSPPLPTKTPTDK
jgi:putative membrane protein